MTEFSYKVTLEASCGAKRFVAYHDEEYMEFHQAGEEAKDYMSSQSCARCREHHDEEDYFPVDVYRGDVDIYPTRVDEYFNHELFEG